MRSRIILLLVVVGILGFSLLVATDAAAGSVGTELWMAGGFSFPDYADIVRACARGGVSVVFMDRFTLGVSGQADRDRYYYFGDASILLPPMGLTVPYARFQVGRRDDVSDTAMGWAAGLRLGEENLSFFLEAHQIFEPDNNFGFSGGISYRL